ncbi:16S rRNA (cytidine(1402)-2'-O)-methyltransferase [Pectinatus haikarae]|uniref:16S rRNA (cytidine(1402)-2'-O)-methyltransferase n=1 Tax=Pectinatus haikarae TaxID=349096 RepID=UPI0018C531B7|nr:16S rRNA (cytidine(1402)-2'-O)-methyltransferase [Pectinatus haikarae]
MEDNKKGTLYLVGTPIGNLDDMTFRAVKILKNVDLIAAEDTRHTRKLLAHFDIHVPLTSYHEHNKAIKGPELIEKLLAGSDMAVVSDAGLPGIADPGSDLVVLALKKEIIVSPIPGANAGLSALISSGISTVQFSFIGFLPKKTSRRRVLLEEVRERKDTLIFYETPHRLMSILREMAEVLGSKRKIAIGRELTKKFEQFIRGTLEEINEYFLSVEPRGEFVLIVEGAGESESLLINDIPPAEYVAVLINKGLTKKAAIKKTADDLHLNRRDVYSAVVKAGEA